MKPRCIWESISNFIDSVLPEVLYFTIVIRKTKLCHERTMKLVEKFEF